MTQQNRREYNVSSADARARLDRFLAKTAPEFSRSRIQTLIRQGYITVNGVTPRPRDMVRAGDRIALVEPPKEAIDLAPEKIALSVLFEDGDLIVIDKPAGISVHPGAGCKSGTLVNALLSHCKDLSGIGGKERPGIVHRLDKETSGCLVVAKTDFAHVDLARQFASRRADKIYLALVAGKLRRASGSIIAPITRHRVHRKKMAIAREGGRMARTDFKVVRTGREASLLECRLHSGRTHQIRVHLQHLGYPILGDTVYGGRHAGQVLRQMLHAWKLGFEHPRGKRRMDFEAPLPDDFANAIREVID
ncbi:MAG TPA: RluA family pseudouridine synthase [Chthoniobacterales bacterium]|nr:RluA family pseudouridine synthase [Chthoniobacterales bacterium]